MTQEALKLAVKDLERSESALHKARAAIKEALAQHDSVQAKPEPEQKPVAWPCLIAEADFSEDTVTLAMQCTDYKVSAGKHWLSNTPPQRKPLTKDRTMEIANQTAGQYWMDEAHIQRFRAAVEADHGIQENT